MLNPEGFHGTGEKPISILQVAEDIRHVAGGVPAVVRQLSAQLVTAGIDVGLVSALDDGVPIANAVESSVQPPSTLGRPWAWSPGLKPALQRLINKADNKHKVVHIHGIWAAPQYYAARIAKKAGIPFVLSAHGMLEPWLWEEQGWLKFLKKRIYWWCFAYPAFRHASRIHAITQIEKENLQQLFPENEIIVIPNATEQQTRQDAETVLPKKRFGFLGRIDPKKGVDILINAFKLAELTDDWHLDIVGPSWSDSYSSALKHQVSQLGLTERVKFIGPLYGEQKETFIRKSWAVVVPSHSEAIGLVNLESAIFSVPTITTPQTGLFDWEEGGGVLASPDKQAIADAIKRASRWSQNERAQRGKSMQRLVQERYSWDAIRYSWLHFYDALLPKY